MIVHIDAPHFNAGAIVNDAGFVERAAPIVGYMQGWPKARVFDYAQRKGWKVTTT